VSEPDQAGQPAPNIRQWRRRLPGYLLTVKASGPDQSGLNIRQWLWSLLCDSLTVKASVFAFGLKGAIVSRGWSLRQANRRFAANSVSQRYSAGTPPYAPKPSAFPLPPKRGWSFGISKPFSKPRSGCASLNANLRFAQSSRNPPNQRVFYEPCRWA
jgi:hypothetical protein